jgi:hypothetical protein
LKDAAFESWFKFWCDNTRVGFDIGMQNPMEVLRATTREIWDAGWGAAKKQ